MPPCLTTTIFLSATFLLADQWPCEIELRGWRSAHIAFFLTTAWATFRYEDRGQFQKTVPLQIRAVNIAIHRAKNGSSKRILISPPPSSSRKMPRSINAPNDLRTVDGPLPRARTTLIDCRLVPPSVMTRINVFCWIAVRPFQS